MCLDDTTRSRVVGVTLCDAIVVLAFGFHSGRKCVMSIFRVSQKNRVWREMQERVKQLFWGSGSQLVRELGTVVQ